MEPVSSQRNISSALLVLLQVRTLLWKRFVYTKRQYLLTTCRIIFGAICVLIYGSILITASSGEVQNPDTNPAIGGIPFCRNGVNGDCVTLYYSPNTTDIFQVMTILGQQNDPPLEVGKDIIYTDMNELQLQLYVNDTTHYNQTQGAVYFYYPANETLLNSVMTSREMRYKIFYNDTTYSDPISFVAPTPYMNYQVQTQLAVDRALITYLTGLAPEIELSLKPFPQTTNQMMQGVLKAVIELILFLALSFPFLITVMQVSSERSTGQRGYMKLVGLRDLSWWIATIVDHGCYFFVLSAVTIVVGYSFYPGLEFFRECNFVVLFIVCLTYGFALLTMAIMISSIVSDKKFVIIVAFCVLCFGVSLIFMVMFSDNSMLGLWDPTFTKKYGPWGLILSFFPPWDLAMILLIIKLQTCGFIWETTQNSKLEGGFGFSDMYTNPADLDLPDYAPTVNYFLLFLLFNGLLYMILAIYFDQVLPDPYRASKHPLYFLSPAYWGCGAPKPHTRRFESSSIDSIIDTDVTEERELVENRSGELTLAIAGLVKEFKAKRKFMCCGKKTEGSLAVDELYLAGEKGSLLCLLGHNGAGKTTTINILTGVLTATAGDAYINGNSVSSDLQKVRQMMGVCPQFDILWDDMTALEHLYLVSGLKPNSWISKQAAEQYLDDVRLLHVTEQDAKTFSGGMKRRLSLAMSICTDPEVIFMDEPTTGMDPGNRRHIWETINKFKKERLIILTTHSMEEADVLGEKIAIMAHGKLKCVGNSLHLKSKYGVGYRLSLITAECNVGYVREVIESRIPNASLKVSNAGSLVFGIPAEDLEETAQLFKLLTEEKVNDPVSGEAAPVIFDWGISQTTLEDVFIRTTQEAHHDFYASDAHSTN